MSQLRNIQLFVRNRALEIIRRLVPVSLSLLLISSFIALGFPQKVLAGYSFREVWFPDGVINWYAETTITPAQVNDVIVPTMAYMSERLPLDIQQVNNSAQSDLMFKKSIWHGPISLLPVDGAWTVGYWAPDGNPKDIAYFTNGAINPRITAHEFGHALGMPHEHQRQDALDQLWRSSNLKCAEPFNYGTAFFNTDVRYHSPFDISSRMIYRNGCVRDPSTGQVPPQPEYNGTGSEALYSPDDINSIYRVYGHALGTDLPNELFGHATAIFDLDDDGFEDIVIAANDQISSNSRRLNLFFYRGVRTDPSEGGSGRKYMPWFVHAVRDNLPNSLATRSYRLTLASGDFNGDERTELAVGYPVSDTERRVRIYGQALPTAFPTGIGSEPWGVKGLRTLQEIAPSDIDPNYSGNETFAQALQAGRLTNSSRDDLLIGWPSATPPPGTIPGSIRLWAKGAVVHLRGRLIGDPLDVNTAVITRNPSHIWWDGWKAGFGSAITVVQGTIGGLDTMVVGAPGENDRGSVYVYGSSVAGGSPVVPPLLAILSGQPNSRFGHALESIHVASSTNPATTHSIVVGTPNETASVSGQSRPVGAVYHYGLMFGSGPTTIELGRFAPPDNLLDTNMQWGYALAVLQEGSSYTGVRIGIGAPGGRSGRGLVYAWRPFTSTGDFSTLGTSLGAPPSGRRYGEVLQAISFNAGSVEHHGFAISAPTGISGGINSGFVQARINQNTLTSGTWNSDQQSLAQCTTGDHLPDNWTGETCPTTPGPEEVIQPGQPGPPPGLYAAFLNPSGQIRTVASDDGHTFKTGASDVTHTDNSDFGPGIARDPENGIIALAFFTNKLVQDGTKLVIKTGLGPTIWEEDPPASDSLWATAASSPAISYLGDRVYALAWNNGQAIDTASYNQQGLTGTEIVGGSGSSDVMGAPTIASNGDTALMIWQSKDNLTVYHSAIGTLGGGNKVTWQPGSDINLNVESLGWDNSLVLGTPSIAWDGSSYWLAAIGTEGYGYDSRVIAFLKSIDGQENWEVESTCSLASPEIRDQFDSLALSIVNERIHVLVHRVGRPEVSFLNSSCEEITRFDSMPAAEAQPSMIWSSINP